ncbi:unnamed protein product [Prunus brigantina]
MEYISFFPHMARSQLSCVRNYIFEDGMNFLIQEVIFVVVLASGAADLCFHSFAEC